MDDERPERNDMVSESDVAAPRLRRAAACGGPAPCAR